MKLIRCYIENFGGLQQYTVDFDHGLTVICEPNGFGKTTLAEFIRAMFYGFPRANKDLQKNPRQKYAPWQGGRYGGYLIFEHEGKRYRIDRSFGSAPKDDKFKLLDETTHRESRDFTSNIGAELFGLDSESFLRSTYMPQTRDNSSLSTDSIRAKLGNLLEDTGDMGNYEKALQRLREKRTAYEHLRGTGGSIHELSRRITDLQNEITLCRGKEPMLEQTANEIEEVQLALTLGDGALQHIRRELSAATTAQAEAALSREYEALLSQKSDHAARLAALRERYPKGMPTAEELDTASKAMDRAAALRGSLQETPADRSAAQTVAANQGRFAPGIPTEEDFARQSRTLDAYTAARRDLQSAPMSDSETALLNSLAQQFREGEPDEAWFTDCRGKQAELARLQLNREALRLSEDDEARLEALNRFFSDGTPAQAELDRHSKQLERAEQLRRETLRMAAAAPAEPVPHTAPQKKFHSLFLPALILGILAAVGGVVLLTADTALPNQMLLGGIAAAAAVVTLIAACFLQINHSLTAKLQQSAATGGISDAQRGLIAEYEQEAAALEADTAAFTDRFPFDSSTTLQRRLSDIQTNLSLYVSLRERARQLEADAAAADRRCKALHDALTQALQGYFFVMPAFDTALHQLETRLQQYRTLREKQIEAASRSAALRRTVDELEQQLLDFLRPYCPAEPPTDFRRALTELQRDADAYLTAQAHVQHRQTALQQRDTQLQTVEKQLADFAAKYGLSLTLDDRAALKAAERDADAMLHLCKEDERTAEALERFLAEHGPKPASALPKTIADPNALKLAEREQIMKQTAHRGRLAQLEQKRQELRRDVDRIPELMDEQARCMEQKAAETENRRLLDETIGFLQKARESLSTSYLGGVQNHFARYLRRLTDEEAGHIAVNTDLEVQLERAGSPRALTYFSAGQTDAVHLCMRLALSDALFEDGKCFMILDDPFVNLDDEHTAQALTLLKELAEDRQIVYLVCNTSRTV